MYQFRLSGLLASVGILTLGATASLPMSDARAQTAAPSAAATTTTTTTKHTESKKKLPDEVVEKQITKLHDQLKITADQEGKWSDVANAMRDGASATSDLIRDRRAHADTMTAVDNIQSYQKIADAHAEGLKKLVPAFSTLYDSLTADQKKTADEIFSHPPGPHPKG